MAGILKADSVEIALRSADGATIGTLHGVMREREMNGEGSLNGDLITWRLAPIPQREGPPRALRFEPSSFSMHFGSAVAPVLRIFPGDSVSTWSLDADGYDAVRKRRTLGGNPLTGPFYIEGALPGDTLVVHLQRIRTNQTTAQSGSRLAPGAVLPSWLVAHNNVPLADNTWAIDEDAGVLRLAHPTGKLQNLVVPLAPMLGCIGVAPPNDDAINAGDLGAWGGNLDYNAAREGTTLYLPIFQTGALLYVGDGHAAQGDGELTVAALETTLDFTFRVDLVPGKRIPNPRWETAEYKMASGVGSSLGEAVQIATTNLSLWLEEDGFNAAEIAFLLGSALRYDIAEIVDPHVHVVAKIPKRAVSNPKQ